MMTLKVGEKELKITFGYEATIKSKIMSKFAKITLGNGKENPIELIEDSLLFLPELILVGLQKEHEEYRYNINTKEGYDEKLSQVFLLVEKYFENGENSPLELLEKIQEEMVSNGFLKKMFEMEVLKEVQTVSNKKNTKN